MWSLKDAAPLTMSSNLLAAALKREFYISSSKSVVLSGADPEPAGVDGLVAGSDALLGVVLLSSEAKVTFFFGVLRMDLGFSMLYGSGCLMHFLFNYKNQGFN